MPVPSLITDIAATLAGNASIPAGGESPILTDDYLRTSFTFIGQLRDGTGFTTAVRSNVLGSVSVPAFSFVGDTNTGAWSPAADTYALSTGGTERMRIDSSGNVGIGTLAPALKLDVNGSAVIRTFLALQRLTGSAVLETMKFANTLGGAASDNLSVGNNGGGSLLLHANSQEAMRIDPSLNIGIGINAPTARLHVASGTNKWATFESTTVPTAFMQFQQGASASVLGYLGSDGAAALSGGTGTNLAIRAENALLLASGGNVERMRIDSSGNVGVGVTPSNLYTPGKVIQMVSGGATLYGSSTTAILANNINLNVSGASLYQLTQAASSYQQDGGSHKWFTAPSGPAGNAITFTQAMTLDSSGNVLIGTTGSGPLNSNSTSISPAATGGVDFNHISGTASGVMYSRFNLAGTTIGSITQSGTTAVLYNTTSDGRLKTHIAPAADAGALLDAVQVRQFDWLSDGSHQRFGFIAQELVEVVPEAVHAPADPDDMMAVDYSKLVPLLVREIQALRARVAALEA